MLPCQPLAVTLPYMGDADGDVRHSIKDARRRNFSSVLQPSPHFNSTMATTTIKIGYGKLHCVQ